jgi:hypothetical protein
MSKDWSTLFALQSRKKWKTVLVHKYPNNKSAGQRPKYYTTIGHKHFFIMHLIMFDKEYLYQLQDCGQTTV